MTAPRTKLETVLVTVLRISVPNGSLATVTKSAQSIAGVAAALECERSTGGCASEECVVAFFGHVDA